MNVEPSHVAKVSGPQQALSATNNNPAATTGAAPKRPVWASHAVDSDSVIAKSQSQASDAKKEAIRDRNYQRLVGLYAGDNACAIRDAIVAQAPKERSFFGKVLHAVFGGPTDGAVRVTNDIALFDTDPSYEGDEGFSGFAYIRESASSLSLEKIPQKMMEDPDLVKPIREGVARVAEQLAKTGKVQLIHKFKDNVST